MFNKIRAVPPAPSNSADQHVSNNSGFKRFGKKLYVAIAVLAIVIIAVAFFIPQGGATIPLSVDYVVGEKMVYDSTMSMTIGSHSGFNSIVPSSTEPITTNITSQQTIEVMSFDGENYLLNHTTTMNVLGRPISVSMTEKMNKTGYSTYLLNVGNTQTEIPQTGVTSDSYLAQLLNKPEVKVGDTVSVPYPSINSSSIQTSGDLTIKFNGVEDLTVPAGTYKVFRIDINSNNLKMTLNPSADTSGIATLNNLSMNLDLNYQVYLEYGTLRQIKSTMQESAIYQSSILNMTANMGMDMTLTQHIKP
jgi:hypothetical protein